MKLNTRSLVTFFLAAFVILCTQFASKADTFHRVAVNGRYHLNSAYATGINVNAYSTTYTATGITATAVTADPDTGELTAPIGVVQALADSVLALAHALGGRSVATATYRTRDPATPLTVAAREGEPVVLDIAGRHFTLPA